jgi:hypothetical protein
MTHDKIINSLDSLIAQLNSFLVKNVNLWHLKDNIVMELKKIGVSPSTINSIRSIEIEDFSRNHLARQYYGSQEYEKMEKNAYTSTISTMINILKQEREAQVQAMQEEAQQKALKEQKKGNWIQIATLIFSALAALDALYPKIESLIKKLLN